MSPLPRRRVSEAELRRRFNEGRYLERVENNELIASVESSRAADTKYGEPAGTVSQTVWYFDARTLDRVALVHELRRPDGTVGASGRPDPKWLLEDGEILLLERPRPASDSSGKPDGP